MNDFGIPYSPSCLDPKHLRRGCIICSFCGKHILSPRMKDVDSFTSKGYAIHYILYHGRNASRQSS